MDARTEGTPGGGSKLRLQVERVTSGGDTAAVNGRILLYIKKGRGRFCTGDRILFSSRLRKPRPFGLPGEIDQARRLAYQRVFETAFVLEPGEIVLLREGAGWRHDVDRVAASLGVFIMTEEPGPEGGVLKALLLGDRGDVPEELNDAYAGSGVNHILSISGFHVGIIFLSLFQLLWFAARRCEFLALRINLKELFLVATLPVLIFYLLLSGQAAATTRSVLMIVVAVAALCLKREIDPVNVIMLAACGILAAAPETFFDVSFQLSFLAIWGVVTMAPALASPFEKSRRAVRWLLLLIAASIAAILATLVPVAYYFQRLSLVGVLANLVIVPLLGYGAVVAGFASLPLSFVAPPAAGALLHIAAGLVKLSDRVIAKLAAVPVITAYAPSRFDILLACLALCAFTFVSTGVRRFFATVPLLLLLVFRAVPTAKGSAGGICIDFLSVGQGDAAVVQLPDGKRMLVDGGGNATDGDARVGARLLVPALRALGVNRLDYLVLSHEHPDHLQGVLHLAANFNVGEFWETGVPSNSPEYLQLKWVLTARAVPVRVVNGTVSPFVVGGGMVEPLWPLEPEQRSRDANADSMVFRLSYGGSSVLFTGDLGGEEEEVLLKRGAPVRCSILKVAHHGSRYSTGEAFLRAAGPQAAVISAGLGNTFHLPAPSTVARLEKRGIRVYRTDRDGTVRAEWGAGGKPAMTTPWGHFN